MRVPHFLLLLREGLKEAPRDDVLNADQARLGFSTVVDDALPHLLVQVPTVVVRFHLQAHAIRDHSISQNTAVRGCAESGGI